MDEVKSEFNSVLNQSTTSIEKEKSIVQQNIDDVLSGDVEHSAYDEEDREKYLAELKEKESKLNKKINELTDHVHQEKRDQLETLRKRCQTSC
ncbi:hypothetical protein SAMD00019534_118370 [Acytostelium subglobosum LB1]|uniref:hypothetical protein n=1 Tax=Acytostelium subglobosum LB1 TaxID=1410327 RepID=UPI00064498EE|nr:hypothetical protein SAMD00019534_118370 [Acytostelium subglobosum LB1]GAM28661.1 hypothetical protein SAMD00019534_118370 [Acytostelium subglobosum LB1]|eukprot:XP_012748439.1 hypothetical protein SAMD00019534_118370 [Acytostelium subglobosum LB1]